MLSLALSFVNMCIGRNGGAAQGGPYLLKVDGTSRVLLVDGTSKLLITGNAPAGAFVPSFYFLGF